MAVAFPIGSGLGLVIGAVIDYIIAPRGNPILLFGGIVLICIAICSTHWHTAVFPGREGQRKRGWTRSSVRSGGWSLLPVRGQGANRTEPLGSLYRLLVFAVGVVLSNFPMN